MRKCFGFAAGLAAAGLWLAVAPLTRAQDAPDVPLGVGLAPDGATVAAPSPVTATSAVAGAATAARAPSRRLRDQDFPGLRETVTLEGVKEWDIIQIIEFLAYRGGLKNIVIGKGVSGVVPKLKFEGASVADALEIVLSVNNLAYEVRGGIITIRTDEEYKALYGESFYNQKQVRMLDLKRADAKRVADVLQPLKSSIGTIVFDALAGTLILIDTPARIEEMVAVATRADTVSRDMPTQTRAFRLQYAAVEDIEDDVKALLTPDVGTLHSDRRTKSLMVTDMPERIAKIEELIRVFDDRHKQVFIEARIVEVDLNDEHRLGINWEHFFEAVDPRFSLRSSVAPSVTGPGGGFTPPAGVGSVAFHTIVGGGDLGAVLAALKTVGETKTLSNPHVAVISDEEATIKVVRDVPYAQAKLESGTTNVVGESITFIEVGVKLVVKPHINDRGLISMAIKPEVSSVVGQYQAFRTVPIVQKAYAETMVMIKDGETIIIAGMITNEKAKSRSAIPVLEKIPVLGWLFTSRGESTLTRETIVFLTPRLISGEEPVLLSRDAPKQPKPLRAVGEAPKALKDVR